MVPRFSLKSFLASAKSALTAPAGQRKLPLTFVVGNEAADLDSLCSALVLAYIHSHTPPKTLHIPLSNIPRADLALRTEMTAVLKHAGLTPADLITLSDLPTLKPEETRWLLVDHNSLTGQLTRYSNQVFGCVDHHVDEGSVEPDAQPRVIEPCGSCMSLVVQEGRAAWDALAKEAETNEEDAEELKKLAKLAFAPVLIDTVNFTAANKVKDSDVRAASYLDAQLRDNAFQRDAYYKEIAAVQEDISQLSFRDIFRKDYKEWTEDGTLLGISSVPQNFEYMVAEAGGPDVLVAELARWAEERRLDVVAVMTAANSDGHFERQLLARGVSDEGAAALERFVGIAAGLELEPWRGGELDGEGGRRRAWQQGDLASSRKQVAPLLREAMKKIRARA
ncbi:putative exopolyphosphatase [Paramyrothecium foliicola]|nr:putative exopolyphosphatase [Paramyrothecium foliicola]